MRWGNPTTRLSCETCGLRFSIDLSQLARTLRHPTKPRAFERLGGMFLAATLQMKSGDLADGGAEEIADLIEQLRHVKPPAGRDSEGEHGPRQGPRAPAGPRDRT